MTIAILTASQPDPISGAIREYTGLFTNDATALVASTVASGGALNARTVTVASATGFANNTPLSIQGGGNAGGTIALETTQAAAPSGNVLTFRDRVLQTAGLTVGATVQQMLKFSAPMRARHARFINETDGVTWEWFDGLGKGQVYKTVWSTGVTTKELSGGPLVVQDGVWFPQAMLGASKTFAFVMRA